MEIDIDTQLLTNIIIKRGRYKLVDRVELMFETTKVYIGVDIDTDELILKQAPYRATKKKSKKTDLQFSNLLGKYIVAYWVCNNHKGYNDVFMLGVGEYFPTLIFTSIGSSIMIQDTHEVHPYFAAPKITE